jgi:O-antigen/teichoic acid export membrane protein
MHPRKFIRDSFNYAFTQYLVRASLMLRGVIAAKLLGPQPYGAWNALQLMMDYGLFAPLGTQQGLDQAVPARMGSASAEQLDRLKRAGLFNILATTLAFGAGCLLWASYGSSRVLGAWGFAGIAGALAVVLTTNLAYYHLTLLRSHGNITAVSGWYFWQGLVGAVIGLAGIRWFGMWSLLWGWLLGTVVAAAYTRWQGRAIAPLAPSPSADSLLLLQVGFPMFVFTGSTLVMRSLDRLIILRYLGTEDLGLYSLAVMALTFLLYLPDSISYVLYPNFVREYSAAGRDPEAIRPRAERVLRSLSLFVPALCGLAWLLSQPMAMAVLPQFLPGVASMRLLGFGAVGLAFAGLCSILLMTVGRQQLLVPVALFVTALGAALDVLAVKLGRGITGVAAATLLTYTLDGALLVTLALAGLGARRREIFGWLGRLFGPLGLALLLAWSIDRLIPARDTPSLLVLAGRTVLECVLFVVGYVLVAAPFGRGLGFVPMLMELRLPLVGRLSRWTGRGGAS